jgi:hypothetical protein
MDQADNGKARARSVANRSPATFRVPAKNLAGDMQAANRVRARSKFHAACWHLEDVCATRCIEYVWPLKKVRERLAIPAVTDKMKAGMRRNFVGDPAHVTAPAPKRKIPGGLLHKI